MAKQLGTHLDTAIRMHQTHMNKPKTATMKSQQDMMSHMKSEKKSGKPGQRRARLAQTLKKLRKGGNRGKGGMGVGMMQ